MCNELVARGADFVNKPVRVVAQIKRFDPRTQRATVELKGAELTVNTQLLGAMLLEEKTLFQFTGEVEQPTGAADNSVTLKARIATPMPGLDLILFEKALVIRREYLLQLLI